MVVSNLPCGHAYTSRSVSKIKSARDRVPSLRLDLSITGICGMILLSFTSQPRLAAEP